MKEVITIVYLVFLTFCAKADGVLISWSPKDLEGMTEEYFESSKSWTIDQILEKNLTATEWPEVYLLLIAAMQHDKEIFDPLVNQLNNLEVERLRKTSRLIIWERITTNEILFEGKGLQVDDDLFTVGGRANWILRTISKKNFGVVKPDITPKDLKGIQKKWKAWFKGKEVVEYSSPYETDITGLSEIRSKEALEALIKSLEIRTDKTSLIKECLKRIYDLEEMPKDPSSSANFCNPDNYTYGYLVTLTGVEEQNSYEWWKEWWLKNKDALQWNSVEGTFELK